MEDRRVSQSYKVVAHFRDGTVIKGTTHYFHRHRQTFRLEPANGDPEVTIRIHRLKALFFVKSFAGNRLRVDARGFLAGPMENAHGVKIAVRFDDKEWLCGYSLSYAPQRMGFYVFPADEGSNNIKVFVVSDAADDVRIGVEAEELAQKFRPRAA
jgi:hypothetical protein